DLDPRRRPLRRRTGSLTQDDREDHGEPRHVPTSSRECPDGWPHRPTTRLLVLVILRPPATRNQERWGRSNRTWAVPRGSPCCRIAPVALDPRRREPKAGRFPDRPTEIDLPPETWTT